MTSLIPQEIINSENMEGSITPFLLIGFSQFPIRFETAHDISRFIHATENVRICIFIRDALFSLDHEIATYYSGPFMADPINSTTPADYGVTVDRYLGTV